MAKGYFVVFDRRVIDCGHAMNTFDIGFKSETEMKEFFSRIALRNARNEAVLHMQDAIKEISNSCVTEEELEVVTRLFGEFMNTAQKTLSNPDCLDD